MSTGFQQLIKGKLQVAQLWLGAGGIVDSVSGIAGKNDALQKLLLLVTAIPNTDSTKSVPAGCTILRLSVYTTVPYTGTTVTIQVGSSAGASDYVAATSIKTVGIVPLALSNAAATALVSMPAGSPNLFIRVVQTGATSVGSAILAVEYSVA